MGETLKRLQEAVGTALEVFQREGLQVDVQRIRALAEQAGAYHQPPCHPEPEYRTDADVHTEHCCIRHGCSYADEGCPVTTGKKLQSAPCEGCGFTPWIDMIE